MTSPEERHGFLDAETDADRIEILTESVAILEGEVAARDAEIEQLRAPDKAADPPWIRIRCDEATVEVIAEAMWHVPGGRKDWLANVRPWHQVPGDVQRLYRAEARAVLAALRDEQ